MNTLKVDNYIIEEPLKNIVLRLKEILNGEKLKDVHEKGSELVVTCPNRDHSNGQEKIPDCHITLLDKSKLPYGTFNCFACGASGSFVKFVALCFDSSIDYAKKWLITNYGKESTEITLDLEPIDLSKAKKAEYLDEKVLDSFQSYHPYMDKRKLTPKVCEAFKVKYDPKSECLVFPVWDEQNRLWMLTRRSVKSKMFYIDKDKEKPVYLMNVIKNKDIQELVVVESQINCLTLWGWNIPAVATFGCNITPKQMEIFNKSNLRHIFLCFDGDAAGYKGTKKFIKNIRPDILVDIIQMPAGKDVNDLTEEEFNALPIVDSQEWMSNESKD